MSYFRELSPSHSRVVKAKMHDVEKEYNFRFPEMYRQFILKYQVGQYLEKWDAYLDHYLRPTPKNIISIKTSTGYVSYNWLSSINQIEHDLKHYPRALDLFKNSNLLRIGDIVQIGGLFLGLGKNDQDKIYKYIYETDTTPGMIFDSIKDFVNGIELKMEGNEDDYKNTDGKRYQKKTNIEYKLSRFLESLESSQLSEWQFKSSALFIDELIQEINNV